MVWLDRGVWLFSVQHRFEQRVGTPEEMEFRRGFGEKAPPSAALPRILQWVTENGFLVTTSTNQPPQPVLFVSRACTRTEMSAFQRRRSYVGARAGPLRPPWGCLFGDIGCRLSLAVSSRAFSKELNAGQYARTLSVAEEVVFFDVFTEDGTQPRTARCRVRNLRPMLSDGDLLAKVL